MERGLELIDTHIHLLPGVDDGAKDMDIAIQMLRIAMNDGVNEMVLTPHFNIPIYSNQKVIEQYLRLKEYISVAQIDFKIHLGNEIYLSEEDVEGVKKGLAFTMGNTRYVLLELPIHQFYPFHEIMIQDLQKRGYKILLAHVERYDIFKKEPEKLKELIRYGSYGQITSQYIMNKKTRKRALQMIKNGLIHIVASDGHGIEWRPPVMKMAYDIVSETVGKEWAQILFIDNPKSMIENAELAAINIKKVKRFHFF